jgi:hypothetical protein
VNPADKPVIEHFVRGTLGCKCPDEVFQSIVIERIPACGSTEPITRLVIGDRLLIYVLDAGRGDLGGGALETLSAQGRADRDLHGLNRFRLVIASSRPRELVPALPDRFASSVGHDDRAHLHVLALDQLPQFARLRSAGV